MLNALAESFDEDLDIFLPPTFLVVAKIIAATRNIDKGLIAATDMQTSYAYLNPASDIEKFERWQRKLHCEELVDDLLDR